MKLFVAALILALGVSGFAQNQNPRVRVVIENRGTLTIELYPDKAPRTVNHILGLVRRNFYDGMRFHRVENQPRPFLVQTGDPQSKTLSLDDPKMGTGGSGTKVPFEQNDVPFLDGTLGLARDVRDRNSGDSQFFIVNGNQRFLEGTYVAFGRVVEGLPIIRQIQLGDRSTSIREVR